MIVAGIDAGSRAIKVLVWDAAAGQVLAARAADQGTDQDARAGRLYDECLAAAGLGRAQVQRVVATGYAREIVSVAQSTVTEITCHGRGVHHELPEARTVVEIGGQDSKLLRLDAAGMVVDFALLRRLLADCAADLDHGYLNETPPFDATNPTSENLARHLAGAVAARLPTGICVHAVRVWESSSCSATYCPEEAR